MSGLAQALITPFNYESRIFLGFRLGADEELAQKQAGVNFLAGTNCQLENVDTFVDDLGLRTGDEFKEYVAGG